MKNDRVLLGFDIGGTKIGIGIGTESGKILGGVKFPNVDTDPNEVLPRLVAESNALAEKIGIKISDIDAFGISAPYPADAERGIMTRPPNNPKWRDVPILGYLLENLQIPGCFENDANCGALAEWFFGAGRGCNDFIYLTMSTGIGGGIIAAGKLVRGAKTRSAGEVGHICIQLNGRKCSCGISGCYEAYCGGRAIAMRIREELKDKPDSFIMRLAGGCLEKIDMKLLVEAVKAKDEYALNLWDEITLRNAQAFGILIDTFNPEKLVLGTFGWAIGDLFIDPIKQKLPQFCWPETLEVCSIEPAFLKGEIGSYAGIAAALNYLREKENCDK